MPIAQILGLDQAFAALLDETAQAVVSLHDALGVRGLAAMGGLFLSWLVVKRIVQVR
jgi:hypothetical protein